MSNFFVFFSVLRLQYPVIFRSMAADNRFRTSLQQCQDASINKFREIFCFKAESFPSSWNNLP